MRKYNAKPQRICSFFIILLDCSESNYVFFFFFQEKRKVDFFIYEIHTIRLRVNHFLPHVKEWNRLAIRSSIKYRETRLKNMSTWKTKVLSKQPNIYTFNSSRFFFLLYKCNFRKQRNVWKFANFYLDITYTEKRNSDIHCDTRQIADVQSNKQCFEMFSGVSRNFYSHVNKNYFRIYKYYCAFQ